MEKVSGKPKLASDGVQWHTVAMASGPADWAADVVCHQLVENIRAKLATQVDQPVASGTATAEASGRCCVIVIASVIAIAIIVRQC